MALNVNIIGRGFRGKPAGSKGKFRRKSGFWAVRNRDPSGQG